MQAEDKQRLRQQMLALRAQLTPQERQEIDDGIFAQLREDADFQHSRTVFAFCSVRGEVSTQAIIEYALQQGKTVCLPRCGEGHRMTAHRITSLEDLVAGKFGIPEPAAHCLAVLPDALDMVLVPCLCADRKGNRVGYGGGFYDRYLAACPAVSVILCPERCLLDTVPVQDFDQRCNKIISEKGVLSLS